MTVYFQKGRDRWRYDFWHKGQRYVDYCVNEDGTAARNKTEARRCEEIAKGRVKSTKNIAPAAPKLSPGQTTFAQAMAPYVTKRQGTKNWKNVETYVRELLAWFGPERAISTVSKDLAWQYINDYSRRQPFKVFLGKRKGWKVIPDRFRSDSTTNRYLDALRTALNEAHEARDEATGKRLLETSPEIPELDEPEDLPNPIPLSVLQAILKTGPDHLIKAIMLTLAFGFRKMEALTLRRKQADWENNGVRLRGSETKGKRGEFLPASPEVMAYLRDLDKEAAEAGVDTFIFYKTKKGTARSITSIKRSWKTALKAQGVEGDYTWHNTKATFLTIMAGLAPGGVVQKWGRHREYSTTQRYLAIADVEKRAAGALVSDRLKAAGIDYIRVPSPTPLSHTEEKRGKRRAKKCPENMARPERFELPTLRFVV